MSAAWRSLEARFWNAKNQQEIKCIAIIVDFGRLLDSTDRDGFIVDEKEALFTAVALYGNCLPEMTAQTLFPVVTKKGVKTIMLLNQHSGFPENEPFGIQRQCEKGNKQNDTEGNVEKDENSTNEEELQSKDDVGEFDDIFSDISDSDEDSSDDGDEGTDYLSEFSEFVDKIRARKHNAKHTEHAEHPEHPEQLVVRDNEKRIEHLMIGAVSYDKSYSLPDETVMNILLLAVRKKYRKCGIGRWFMERLKDPDVVGPYDVITTYADSDATKFFKNNGFTDDYILNSKYWKTGDNWLNSIPMCFLPPFDSKSLSKRSGCTAKAVSTEDIELLERKIEEWKVSQTKSYQNQMKCILTVMQQLKMLRHTTESQQRVIERLKEENIKLLAKIKQGDSGIIVSSDNHTEESRISFEFTQQLLVESLVLNVDVISIKKAPVSRENFYTKLEALQDPLMFTELYFCAGSSKEWLDRLLQHGFSAQDCTAGCYGKGLYFSQSARKAMEFSKPGVLLVCLVGLGNTYSMVKEDNSRISPPVGCDSVLTIGRRSTGNIKGQEYVIYDVSQAVPVYLIEYSINWAT